MPKAAGWHTNVKTGSSWSEGGGIELTDSRSKQDGSRVHVLLAEPAKHDKPHGSRDVSDDLQEDAALWGDLAVRAGLDGARAPHV